MVQIIKGGTQKRDSDERLGYAMGKSISDTLLNFGANKALDSVINDESLKDAAPSERLSKLQQALSPYGDKGKEVFGHRLMIEEQRYKEREQETLAKAMGGKTLSQKEQGYLSPQSRQQVQKQKQSQILGKLLNKQYVSPEDRALLSPEQNLAYARHEHSISKQAKPLASSQPIDADQLNKIKEVRNRPEYKDATPLEKYHMLTENLVSSPLAKNEADIATDEMKNAPGQEYAKGREKDIKDYVTNALKSGEEAENMRLNMDTIESALQGNITEPGIMATLKHDPYGQLFFGLTPDEATLTTANKYMLEGTKGIWGAKPTEREMFTLLNGMLPSVGKTKEANLAGLQVIKRANDIKYIRSELVDRITDGGKKYVPDVESQVNKEMKPIIEEFRKEALQLKNNIDESQKIQTSKAKEGKIRVESPDGDPGYMTQQQIDNAGKENVIFKPI